MATLKILFVSGGVPWTPDMGGGYLIAFKLAQHLAKRGHRVDYLTNCPEEYRKQLDNPSPIYIKSWGHKDLPLREFMKVFKQLPSYDIIHAHGAEAVLFSIYSRLRGFPPCFISIYDPDIPVKRWCRQTAWDVYRKIGTKLAAKVLVLSEFSRKNVNTVLHIPVSRIMVIPPGVRTDFQSLNAKITNPNQSKKSFNLLFVGRLEYQKGLDVLIKALSIITSKHRVTLTVIGAGSSMDEYRNLAKQYKVNDIICFKGYIPPDELPPFYRAADIFVGPSRYESFGLTFAEAMAAGLPVVATDVSAIPEVVVDGKTGILVPPDNPDALSLGIEKLIENVELRENFGLAGMERAKTEYIWEHSAHQLEQLYLQELLQ